MTQTEYLTDRYPGLPDPEIAPEFYADVISKRGLAWVVDTVLIGLLVAVILPFTFFIGFFFLPILWGVVAFGYRWWSLSARSATPGMRLFAIELRDRHGARLDPGLSMLHVAGYYTSMAIFPLQLVSIAVMFAGGRRQGLTDHVLGTAAINRAAA